MITNATITRIDSPGVPDAGGNVAWAQGAALVCRCALTPLSARDRYAAAELEEEADAILTVKVFDLQFALNQANYTVGTSIVPEQRLLVVPDPPSSPAVYYRVRQADQRPGFSASIKALLRAD